jgi:hypothetical protein
MMITGMISNMQSDPNSQIKVIEVLTGGVNFPSDNHPMWLVLCPFYYKRVVLTSRTLAMWNGGKAVGVAFVNREQPFKARPHNNHHGKKVWFPPM